MKTSICRHRKHIKVGGGLNFDVMLTIISEQGKKTTKQNNNNNNTHVLIETI